MSRSLCSKIIVTRISSSNSEKYGKIKCIIYRYLYVLISIFFLLLDSLTLTTFTSNKCHQSLSTPTGSVDMDKVHYCERFLELLVDLEVLN